MAWIGMAWRKSGRALSVQAVVQKNLTGFLLTRQLSDAYPVAGRLKSDLGYGHFLSSGRVFGPIVSFYFHDLQPQYG